MLQAALITGTIRPCHGRLASTEPTGGTKGSAGAALGEAAVGNSSNEEVDPAEEPGRRRRENPEVVGISGGFCCHEEIRSLKRTKCLFFLELIPSLYGGAVSGLSNPRCKVFPSLYLLPCCLSSSFLVNPFLFSLPC